MFAVLIDTLPSSRVEKRKNIFKNVLLHPI